MMCNNSNAERSLPKQRGKRGEGSCYQLKDGTWRVAVPFGKGRRRTARAHSAAEAEEHRRALLRQREAGVIAELPATGGRQTLRQWNKCEQRFHFSEAISV